ncbi:t-complex protein 1 subunit delta [Trichonephila clavipes]|nr:t-complex protein 1 subunit delta [Trichonephila clavipes]
MHRYIGKHRCKRYIKNRCFISIQNDASLNQCSHKYHFDVAIHRRFDVELSFISIFSKSGSTSNLFGHLRLHHPLQFSEVSNKSKVVTATVQYSPFCAAVDESIDEPQPQSNMAVSKSINLTLLTIIGTKRQKFMTDFQRLDDQASKRTTDSVTKFLVAMQPYNLVDRKEFINMVKVLNPRYSLPGRKHFTATGVPKTL